MFRFYTFFILLLCNVVTAQPLTEAKQAFKTGHYEQAILHWQTVLATTQNTNHRLEAWYSIARAYRWLGDYQNALKTIETALPIANQNLIYHALLQNELSKLRLAQGEKWYEQAQEIGEQAVKIAKKTNNPLLLAEVLKHQGNLLTTDYNYEDALEVYQEALVYVNSSERIPSTPPFSTEEMETLYGKILISQAQTTFLLEKDDEVFTDTIAKLEQAVVEVKNWPPLYDQVMALVNLGQLVQKIQSQLPQPSPQLTAIAYQVLYKAKEIAEHLDNMSAKSYANGYFGQLYEQAKRYDEALALTRQAIFFTRLTESQRLIYLWQWQLGRIKRATGDNEGAIKDYQQAIKYLDPIRIQAMTGYFNFMSNFRTQIAPIYFDLADSLLQLANSTHVNSARNKLLHQAVVAIEAFKEAELQNYFQSDCIDLKNECADVKGILDAKTAILYPIMFPTRLELLLYRHDGIVQATLSIKEKTLHRKIGSFLSRLRHHPNPDERARNRSMLAGNESTPEVCTPSLRGGTSQKLPASSQTFLGLSQTLYSWLIKPLTPHLGGIETLVVVPDGALRTIPFAALQHAQKLMLTHESYVRYRHPYYWSAFLLIGEWF